MTIGTPGEYRGVPWTLRVLAGECNLTAATTGKLAFALGMRVTAHVVPIGDAASRSGSGGSGTPA